MKSAIATTFYRVNKYRNRRPSQRWKHPYSVDQVGHDGHYISQEAFWFDFREDAEARMNEMIVEDAARGVASAFCGLAPEEFN